MFLSVDTWSSTLPTNIDRVAVSADCKLCSCRVDSFLGQSRNVPKTLSDMWCKSAVLSGCIASVYSFLDQPVGMASWRFLDCSSHLSNISCFRNILTWILSNPVYLIACRRHHPPLHFRRVLRTLLPTASADPTSSIWIELTHSAPWYIWMHVALNTAWLLTKIVITWQGSMYFVNQTKAKWITHTSAWKTDELPFKWYKSSYILSYFS